MIRAIFVGLGITVVLIAAVLVIGTIIATHRRSLDETKEEK